jgi:glycerophosphoryl diester phosphodiesterase
MIPKGEGREFLLIAHRAGAEFGPENTLEALRRALDQGVLNIETDVRQTSDRSLVIHHDPIIGLHLISKHGLEELREYYPQLATLGEFLEIARGRCGLNLEIKKAEPELVASFLRAENLQGILISSFEEEIIRQIRGLLPETQLGILINSPLHWHDHLDFAISAGLEVILPYHHLVERSTMEKAHIAGIKVIPWTVNRIEELDQLIALGVNGAITDRYLLMRDHVDKNYPYLSLVPFSKLESS